jgi:hypothetical protein
MAFHPLRTFQKNRKFWMATILLVCMVTFVLCTGFSGGDFGDWLLRILGRNRGDEVTRIDGHSIYRQDLDELKAQRDLANDYMRKATRFVISQLKMRIEDAGKESNDKIRKQRLGLYVGLQDGLVEKLNRPRYFGGGTKLDELIDFMLWRNQADRLGIYLTDDAVRDLVAAELYSTSPRMQEETRWGPEAAQYVHSEVRQGGFWNANYRVLLQALTDEFRVRMAQAALEKGPGAALQLSQDTHGGRRPQLEAPMQTRMPVTPQEVYEYYRKERAPAEIALIPVHVERFFGEVPTPTQDDLERLFKEGRVRRYDPASLEPGFQLPSRAQISWLTVDPKSRFYTHAAQAATTLQAVPPVLYDPAQPLALTAAAYAARSAAWEASLQLNYEFRRKRQPEAFEVAGLATPYFALALFTKGLAEPKATSVAALAAGAFEPSALGGTPFAANVYAALSAYQLPAYQAQSKELAPILQYERRRRVPIGTTMVLSRAISPIMAAGLQTAAFEFPQFLVDRRQGPPRRSPREDPFQPQSLLELLNAPPRPQPMFLPLLGPVKEKIREGIQTRIAEDWAKEIFRELKTRLDAKAGGKALKVELDALRNEPRFRGAFTVGASTGWVTPYTAADDPGLAPLKKSYEKYYKEVNDKAGLIGSEGMLGPDDFAQLFFGTQPFAVGNTLPYNPRPWPPTVTRRPTDLDRLLRGKDAAEQTIHLWSLPEVQAFLFWRTASQPSQPPTDLDAVRAEVEHAWKVRKARAGMAARLKKLTEPLVAAGKKPNPDLMAAIREEAKKLDKDQGPILVPDVAPLVEIPTPRGDLSGQKITAYGPFTLPRGKILHPRPDAAKDLLALRDLKAPLKTGLADIDTLNAELFKATKDSGRPIQVLTNQPQTVFYVAALVQPPKASNYEFFVAYRGASGSRFSPFPSDLFVQQCQNAHARQYREDLTLELRRLANVQPISDQVRRSFDRDGGP